MTPAQIEAHRARIDLLNEELTKLRDEAVEKDETIVYDYKRFGEIGNHLKQEITQLDQTIRLNQEPEFHDLPEYGDRMPLTEFIKHCQTGCFINYDGFGRYIRDNKESQIDIYPSDVKNNAIRTDFQEIIWYNR